MKKRGKDSGSLCLSKAALFPWAGTARGQRAALHVGLFYCPDTGLPGASLHAGEKRWCPCEARTTYRAADDGHLLVMTLDQPSSPLLTPWGAGFEGALPLPGRVQGPTAQPASVPLTYELVSQDLPPVSFMLLIFKCPESVSSSILVSTDLLMHELPRSFCTIHSITDVFHRQVLRTRCVPPPVPGGGVVTGSMPVFREFINK